MMQREGAAIEEKFFDLSLLPIVGHDEHERPAGVLDELVDVTQTVRGRRRRDSVRYVGQAIGSATTLKQLWPAFLTGLEPAVVDAPYAIVYSIQDDDIATKAESFEKKCVLEGAVGIDVDYAALPEQFGISMQLEAGPGIIKACLRVWQNLEPITLHSADGSLPTGLCRASLGRAFDDEVRTAIIMPIMTAVADEEILGILIIGLSPRSPYDEEYKLWTHIVSDLVRKTATLIILPEEQRRAQRIANELNNLLVHQLRITTLQAEQSEGKFRRMAESAPQGMCEYTQNHDHWVVRHADLYNLRFQTCSTPRVEPFMSMISILRSLARHESTILPAVHAVMIGKIRCMLRTSIASCICGTRLWERKCLSPSNTD